jgi:hypothetical protein
MQLWRPLADQGNGLAQNNLGFMYQNGRSVPKDDGEASWYKAANQPTDSARPKTFVIADDNGGEIGSLLRAISDSGRIGRDISH